ncbi:MAG TPA: class I SAM-dependent methyltransferase [Kineosporiaceae bacterium]|nr:class I SAM-dependent methyltransferase [Kineosporiaceae bacterium]
MTVTQTPVAAGSATLVELTHAVQAAAALAAAARTGTLTALEEGPATAEQVASGCGTSPRHTELLLVALQALGVVDRSLDGVFRLAAAPLDFLERTRLDWACTEDVVRTGRSLHEVETSSGAQRLYPSVVPGLSVLGAQAAAVAARSLAPAGRVLDAGAGAAPWSAAIARADAGARITALDLAPVLATTREEVAAAGLEDRFTFQAADLMSVVPEAGAYDLVLLANVCHLFDDATNAGVVARLCRGLAPGGRLAVVDVLPEIVQGGSRRSAMLALYELGLAMRTGSGGVHALSAYQRWAETAGLEVTSVEPLDPRFPVHLIVATRR